jgi:hypothetical protein
MADGMSALMSPLRGVTVDVRPGAVPMCSVRVSV